MVHEPLLHGHREKFSATIGLNPLKRKRHLLQDALQERQRTDRCTAAENRQHSITRAIVNRGVLIASRSDLAGVELDAVPRNEPRIPMSGLPPRRAHQRRHVTVDQNLVNRVSREPEIMMAPQLTLNTSCSQLPVGSQLENQQSLSFEYTPIG